MANVLAPVGFQQYSGTGSSPTYEQFQTSITSANVTPIFQGDPVTNLTSGRIAVAPIPGTAITVTGASNTTGILAVLTYSAIAAGLVPPVGSVITVTGSTSTGSGYNGTYTVSASSTTSVSYASSFNGTWVSGGSIVSTPVISGIFQGCKYYSISQKKTVWSPFWPGYDATGEVLAYVVNDPNAQFIVQTANSATTASAVGVANIGANIGFNYGSGGNTSSGISGAYADQSTIDIVTSLPFRIVGLANYTPGGPNPLQSINGNDFSAAYNAIIVKFNNFTFNVRSGV
jgi:hypothetical protein